MAAKSSTTFSSSGFRKRRSSREGPSLSSPTYLVEILYFLWSPWENDKPGKVLLHCLFSNPALHIVSIKASGHQQHFVSFKISIFLKKTRWQELLLWIWRSPVSLWKAVYLQGGSLSIIQLSSCCPLNGKSRKGQYKILLFKAANWCLPNMTDWKAIQYKCWLWLAGNPRQSKPSAGNVLKKRCCWKPIWALKLEGF